MVRVLLFTIVTALYIGVANSVISPNDLLTFVKFNLYSRSNENSLVRIRIGDGLNDNFNAGRPTKFIVHGFMENSNMDWVLKMKNSFLQANDVNVFAVGWEQFTSVLDGYSNARTDTKYVGNYLGEFLEFLATNWTMNLDSVHCVGHSLGAHLCGYAGKALTSGKMHRITGLDPSGLQFSADIPTEILAPTDAVFVDAFHTATNTVGLVAQVAHVDIYPNGGASPQPGCILADLFLLGLCSHLRSAAFFSESIVTIPPNPPQFVAKKCDDNWLNTTRTAAACTGAKAIVGANIDETLRGIFYLPTASDSPFALG